MLSYSILLILALCGPAHSFSAKRGLVYISSSTSRSDDKWWPSSDLTWYYNFWYTPISLLSKSGLQYVPMLWGAPDSGSSGEFYNTVKSLKSSGMNITHVLGFNEPDGPRSTGGSAISVTDAVGIWMREMEPLRKLGVRVGAPAVTGNGAGIQWLQDFVQRCNGCGEFDFVPIHYYGPFEGLPSLLEQFREATGNQTLWVTEFAFAQSTLQQSQDFVNRSTAYLDDTSFVERYSYFGTYRDDVSNWVGSSAAMLDSKGDLTAIGRWYSGSRGKDTGTQSDSSRNRLPLKWVLAASFVCVWIFN